MPEKRKILIIEDEKSLARALELKLKHSGFEAIAVFNGEEGIKLLLQKHFSLILLDLIMPKMDGYAVLEAIRAHKIKTPVMILSNLSQESDLTRAKELGATGFFIKSNTSIATIVDRVIHILK